MGKSMSTNKKGVIFVCTLLLIAALLFGCKPKTGLPRWYFGVEGAETKVFSSFDYAKLDETSITVERAQEGVSEELRGVRLKDVLDYLNVSEYSSITLSSRDGSSIEYMPKIIEEPATLLVFEVNGRTQWENGVEIVQVVAGNQPEELWLWNLKTLTVNP
jgi:hypothetical protein